MSTKTVEKLEGMRAIVAEGFGGYQNLKAADIPKPAVSDGRVLVRVTAAGVTPLDYTILSGNYPMAKAPLVLGNEGAGVVEEGGDDQFPDGSRVMFTGPYGVFENGAFSEWVAVKKEHLCLIPENIGDAAAGLPVAYLTAFLALRAAGFQPGKTVLSPAIGGSVGNAVTQLARALGARHAISTTTSHAKAEEARKLGFSEVVDLSKEGLVEGVRRLTDGYGADIIVDGVGGDILSAALEVLAPAGSLTTLGYAASRKTTIDLTNLIWKGASMKSFSLFNQPTSAWAEAWAEITGLLKSGQVKPIVAKIFSLEDAAEALRYLIEGRPFGRVLVAI
jgi:NADPH:quinone reductase